MNNKLIIAIVAAVLLGAVVGYGAVQYQQENAWRALVADELENNIAAQELAQDYGVEVVIEELGQDSNGLEVRGQSWIQGNQCVKVILDDDVDPNSYDAHAILYHEIGHVYNNAHGLVDDEAAADDYAASRGYKIIDAYNGIR